jgi:hypothetical protein
MSTFRVLPPTLAHGPLWTHFQLLPARFLLQTPFRCTTAKVAHIVSDLNADVVSASVRDQRKPLDTFAKPMLPDFRKPSEEAISVPVPRTAQRRKRNHCDRLGLILLPLVS